MNAGRGALSEKNRHNIEGNEQMIKNGHNMSTRKVDHSLLAITGYTDRLSLHPGESVRVHASSTHKSGSLRLVRLGHDGKQFTKEEVTSPTAIDLTHREVVLESYGIVDKVEFPGAPLVIHVWVWVSLWPDAEQNEATLLATEDLGLTVDVAGKAVFRVGENEVKSAVALQLRRWYQVTGGLDVSERPFVSVQPQRSEFGEAKADRTVGETPAVWKPRSGALVIGRGLDGKLEDVRITRSESDEVSNDVLRLDFAFGISTWLLHDHKGAPVGRVLGLPTRGVRGRRWHGSEHAWRHAPDQYAAIHFHTDDQGDQLWPVTATVKLPDNLPVGVYAIELSAGSDIDHLPVIVRRKHGEVAPLLVLVPTLSYLAYASECCTDEALLEFGWKIKCRELCAEFARANKYRSMYDKHADGSPVVLSSLHRPLLNVRPDHKYRPFGCEHGFSADLHLIGWLTRQGLAFDVATDHDLDVEGVKLVAPYRGVLTGNHPEYWSGRMLDAIDTYLDTGGSLAYLGGNGFFWTSTIDPDDSSVMEMRRGQRGLMVEGDVGEEHFQLTGLPAGLWSTCGRMAGAMVGVTWTCQGQETGAPYRRNAASFDPRVAHLFVGIGDEELIGEKGAFLGAAASMEVDLAHPLLGTPAHALVVATAAMPVSYDIGPLFPILALVDKDKDKIRVKRSDIVYLEARGGGAVFSTGTEGWIGALSHDGDRNAASRLTANALRSFIEGRR